MRTCGDGPPSPRTSSPSGRRGASPGHGILLSATESTAADGRRSARRGGAVHDPPVIDDARVASLRAFFSEGACDVVCARLFGSRAAGAGRPDSDVDLGVILAEGACGDTLSLELALRRHLGLPIDVVDLERAPADLVHRVLRGGILLLDADPRRRVRVEVRPHPRRGVRLSTRSSIAPGVSWLLTGCRIDLEPTDEHATRVTVHVAGEKTVAL